MREGEESGYHMGGNEVRVKRTFVRAGDGRDLFWDLRWMLLVLFVCQRGGVCKGGGMCAGYEIRGEDGIRQSRLVGDK